VRTSAGEWVPAYRQGKTRRNKENGALWGPVSAIIDRHVLGDRPPWAIAARMAELDGMYLFALGPEPIGTYQPSSFLREEFGISAHLVRTLVTDLLRRHQPDAAWAVKLILGHTTRTMQQTYQTDFREVAAVEKVQATLAKITAAAEQTQRPRRRRGRSAVSALPSGEPR
jgi:hypothetical protein